MGVIIVPDVLQVFLFRDAVFLFEDRFFIQNLIGNCRLDDKLVKRALLTGIVKGNKGEIPVPGPADGKKFNLPGRPVG